MINILDLTLAGAVGGLNRLFYAQMRRTTAAAAAKRVHFVENGRPEQTNFQKIYADSDHKFQIFVFSLP